MKVYLEIAIGDLDHFTSQESAYKRGLQFVKEHASWIQEEEIESQAELLKEMVAQRPDMKDKDDIIFSPPTPLIRERVEIELFSGQCPKTCQNFYHLCKGDKGLGKASKKPLHYPGTHIFRVVPGFIAQGGDITRDDGSGGDSIYGGKFNDEKAGLTKFTQPGQLGMANSGKNSNTSQFFFTLPGDAANLSKLNGKYVKFGQITKGLEILSAISETPLQPNSETPLSAITIISSGTIE